MKVVWICSRLFWITGGAWKVPMVTPWASRRRGVMTTATVEAGASAVLRDPGCAIGLVIVLLPWLMTVAVMPSVPPQRRGCRPCR